MLAESARSELRGRWQMLVESEGAELLALETELALTQAAVEEREREREQACVGVYGTTPSVMTTPYVRTWQQQRSYEISLHCCEESKLRCLMRAAQTAAAAAAVSVEEPQPEEQSPRKKRKGKGKGKGKPSEAMIEFLRGKRERVKALRAVHAEGRARVLGELGELELDAMEEMKLL